MVASIAHELEEQKITRRKLINVCGLISKKEAKRYVHLKSSRVFEDVNLTHLGPSFPFQISISLQRMN